MYTGQRKECGENGYIVIAQAFDRLAEGVGHGLVGVRVDDEDADRRHSVARGGGVLLRGEGGDCVLGAVW